MSRRRYISTDISTDPKVAELAEYGPLPLLLYTWAIPHLDDWGRIIGEARQFKLLVCPALDVTASAVDEALSHIASVGLWERYEVEGRKYIAVGPESWFRHQTYINHKKREEDKSQYPSPFESKPKNAAKHRETPHNAEERQKAEFCVPSPSPSPSLSLSLSLSSAQEQEQQRQQRAHACEPSEVVLDAPGYTEEEGKQIESLAAQLTRHSPLYSDELNMIRDLYVSGIKASLIIRVIQETIQSFVPKHEGDRVKKLTYCRDRILELHASEQRVPQRIEMGVNMRGEGRASPVARSSEGVERAQSESITGGRVGWIRPASL